MKRRKTGQGKTGTQERAVDDGEEKGGEEADDESLHCAANPASFPKSRREKS